MKKVLSKKSINYLQKNAEIMTDKEFKTQVHSIIEALAKSVQVAMEEGKLSSHHFYNSVNKEIDILSQMINSSDYTSMEKIQLSNRIEKLVDKLHKKDIIKDVTILSTIGALGLAIVGFIFHKKYWW